MKIHIENGDLNISFQNIMHMTDAYGKIIGAIHAIAPYDSIDNETKQNIRLVQHLTMFFFSKGYTHTTKGFMMGWEEGLSEDRLIRVHSLKTALNLMPFFPETYDTNILYSNGIGSIENVQYYVFGIPKECQIDAVSKCRGMICFNNAIQILQDDGEDIHMEQR